jgi:hypothetical protein
LRTEKILSLTGTGQFAVVSRHPEGVKVSLHASRTSAKKTLASLVEADPTAIAAIHDLDLS